ncbi:FtsX-like permease family protein [Micromonospora sp. LOL_021]|uniref:FtsX-like permease family protein n=1 Tax=Micromonospora sp. LOL_021 TaxID=3345417 RepID=UPI003A8B219E
MISLLLSMVAARRGQAVVVCVLSVFATAAAVTGPAYLAAADRAVVAAETSATGRSQRTVSLSVPDLPPGQEGAFRAVTKAVGDLPGFRTVYSVQSPILGVESVATEVSYLVFREDVCAHLRMVEGRCLMSPYEVVLGLDTARRLGVVPGQGMTITVAQYDPGQRIYRPAGAPAQVTVVGLYAPLDPDALYWGRTPYFVPGTLDAYREPVFAGRFTVDDIDRPGDFRSVEALASDDALRPERLPALDRQLDDIGERLSAEGGGFVHLTDSVSSLLDRIAQAQALTRQVVPVAAVPLVILCLFVVFMAVAAGTVARRTELGLLALRGTPRRARWLLAAGEPAVAIALGAPVGYLLGSVFVGVLAGLRLEGRFAPVTSGTAVLAGCATLVGALAVAILAQRRELASPVVDLLRRVPPRTRRWASLLVEAVMLALTVVAVAQLRLFDSELVGLSLLVPALIGVTVALVAARLVAPLTGRLGAAALRRGRLAAALGLLHLARQPAGQRLFTLLTVTVAVTGYAAVAFDVAEQSRSARAEVQAGTDRALTVLPVPAGTLLTAVRSVDPDGRYAMAVGRAGADAGTGADIPVLLADTAALAATAQWRPEFGPADSAEVADRLRTPAGAPVAVTGTELAVELTLAAPGRTAAGPPDDDAPPVGDVRFTVHLRSPSGRMVAASVTASAGQRSYPMPVDCADGCQLAGFSVRPEAGGGAATSPEETTFRVVPDVTVTGLAVDGTRLLDPAALADETRWRLPSGGAVDVDPAGLRVRPGDAADPWILPADVPLPLPALVTRVDDRPQGLKRTTMRLETGAPVESVTEAPVEVLPALGTRGLLVDLEYAVRSVPENTVLDAAQVWLSRDAPADVAERLDAAGLTVTGEVTPERVRQRLDRTAPALAIWFHLLAAALAVVLACAGMVLLAVVERSRRGEDLTALTVQGLPARTAARSLRWSALPAVVLATVTGLGAALLAWWATGGYLPVATDGDIALAPVEWPRPVAVLLPVIGVMLLFGAVALALGRALRVRD